jgi:hypothetical protein
MLGHPKGIFTLLLPSVPEVVAAVSSGGRHPICKEKGSKARIDQKPGPVGPGPGSADPSPG